jgi:hypothetical protein
MLTALREWSQKRRLRAMLKDPRSTRGFRSTGQLEKGPENARKLRPIWQRPGTAGWHRTAWWAREDSNLQPDRYERSALTIELRARNLITTQYRAWHPRRERAL